MEIIKNTKYNKAQGEAAFRALKSYMEMKVVKKVVIDHFQHERVVFRAHMDYGVYFVIIGPRGGMVTGWDNV